MRSERRRYHREIALGADAGDRKSMMLVEATSSARYSARRNRRFRGVGSARSASAAPTAPTWQDPTHGDGALCGAFDSHVIIVQIVFRSGHGHESRNFELYIDDHTLVSGLFSPGLTGRLIWGPYSSCSA